MVGYFLFFLLTVSLRFHSGESAAATNDTDPLSTFADINNVIPTVTKNSTGLQATKKAALTTTTTTTAPVKTTTRTRTTKTTATTAPPTAPPTTVPPSTASRTTTPPPTAPPTTAPPSTAPLSTAQLTTSSLASTMSTTVPSTEEPLIDKCVTTMDCEQGCCRDTVTNKIREFSTYGPSGTMANKGSGICSNQGAKIGEPCSDCACIHGLACFRRFPVVGKPFPQLKCVLAKNAQDQYTRIRQCIVDPFCSGILA